MGSLQPAGTPNFVLFHFFPLASKVINVTRNGLACMMRASMAMYVQNLSQIVAVRSIFVRKMGLLLKNSGPNPKFLVFDGGYPGVPADLRPSPLWENPRYVPGSR